MVESVEIETTLGSMIRIAPAPEHLGEGLLMEFSMKDPEDHRRSEVYLSTEVAVDLVGALDLLLRREDRRNW